MTQPRIKALALGIFSVTLILALWQFVAAMKLTPGINLPELTATLVRAYELRFVLLVELGHTLGRALTGYGLAVITMIPLGLAMGRSRLLDGLLDPVIEVLRPLPTPAIIPLIMLLAGIGDAAKIGIIFFGAAFPILINTAASVRGLHPMIPLTTRALRLTRLEAFVLAYLPAATPQIIAGCRISLSLALLIAVTAEMLLSTDGLGVFLQRSQETFLFTDVLAGIIVLAACAFTINRLFIALEHRLLFWHKARTA